MPVHKPESPKPFKTLPIAFVRARDEIVPCGLNKIRMLCIIACVGLKKLAPSTRLEMNQGVRAIEPTRSYRDIV